jgi:hypothetical protein
MYNSDYKRMIKKAGVAVQLLEPIWFNFNGNIVENQ